MATLKLGNTTVSTTGDEVYIIAEIGQNHQGSVELAKRMIAKAKEIGCHCVKFQKSCLSAKFTRSALNRPYENYNSWGRTYGEHKEHLEFTLEQYQDLQAFCKSIEIDFTASAMDVISLNVLSRLNVPFIKIGSGDTDNFPLLEEAAKLGHPLVISTGMQTMETIDRVVGIMKQANKTDYALLHCVSAYPTEAADCTLSLIPLLRRRFPHVLVGYSGHELGIDIAKAALLMGAKIVERHFTLDKNQKGSDHNCSLDPFEFDAFLKEIEQLRQSGCIRRAPLTPNEIRMVLRDANQNELDLALKDVGEKVVRVCEMPCKQKLGKSIVAKSNLSAGHRLEQHDICIKVSEPSGISAQFLPLVLGRTLTADVNEDEPISAKDVLLL